MRKAQKQEIMELLQTLHEAHDEIKNDIDKRIMCLRRTC